MSDRNSIDKTLRMSGVTLMAVGLAVAAGSGVWIAWEWINAHFTGAARIAMHGLLLFVCGFFTYAGGADAKKAEASRDE